MCVRPENVYRTSVCERSPVIVVVSMFEFSECSEANLPDGLICCLFFSFFKKLGVAACTPVRLVGRKLRYCSI